MAISGYEKVLASLAGLSAPFVPFVADGDMVAVVVEGYMLCDAKEKRKLKEKTLFISMRKLCVPVRSRRRGK